MYLRNGKSLTDTGTNLWVTKGEMDGRDKSGI